jgi:hypothetical protein
MQADHFGFIGYVYVVLESARKVVPEVEKVDFLVESNGDVTKNLQYFYSAIPAFLTSIGKQDLIPLVGEIIPGGKDRSPLQAADVFCWHARRGTENSLAGNDLARWEGFLENKKYCLANFPKEAILELAEDADKLDKSASAQSSP